MCLINITIQNILLQIDGINDILHQLDLKVQLGLYLYKSIKKIYWLRLLRWMAKENRYGVGEKVKMKGSNAQE